MQKRALVAAVYQNFLVRPVGPIQIFACLLQKQYICQESQAQARSVAEVEFRLRRPSKTAKNDGLSKPAEATSRRPVVDSGQQVCTARVRASPKSLQLPATAIKCSGVDVQPLRLPYKRSEQGRVQVVPLSKAERRLQQRNGEGCRQRRSL